WSRSKTTSLGIVGVRSPGRPAVFKATSSPRDIISRAYEFTSTRRGRASSVGRDSGIIDAQKDRSTPHGRRMTMNVLGGIRVSNRRSRSSVLCPLRYSRTYSARANGRRERASAVDRGRERGRSRCVRGLVDAAGRDRELGDDRSAVEQRRISTQSLDSRTTAGAGRGAGGGGEGLFVEMGAAGAAR